MANWLYINFLYQGNTDWPGASLLINKLANPKNQIFVSMAD